MILKDLSTKIVSALLFAATCMIPLAAEFLSEPDSKIRPPVIDGKLNDQIWESACKLTGLKTYKPDFGKDLSEKTDVFIAHDRHNIYLAFRCRDRQAQKIKTSVTKRDNMFAHDLIGIVLNTFGDNQSAYGFVVNPQGIQGDGMMDAGGDLDPSADFVWFSKGRLDSGGYTVECRIPASSIRFPAKKELRMGVMVIRQIVRTSEMGTFPEVPADSGAFLSHCMPVDFSGLKYKRVVEILPAFTSSRLQVHEGGQMSPAVAQSDISLTAKVGLTSGLTMDATCNPDFSQVESDAGQVDVNLRHSLYYEEKRPFFLEGMEIFNFAGNTDSAPLRAVVHTRNIGDPLFGLKLSGKVGPKDTLALLYAKDELDAPSAENQRADFAVLRFRHAFSADSFLGGFVTSRSAGGEFNRVVGADGLYRLNSASAAEFHLLGSFSRAQAGSETVSGHALGTSYSFANRKSSVTAGIQDISKSFRADSGFLTRDGLTRLAARLAYRFYPGKGFIQKIEPLYKSYHIYDKYSKMVETSNLFSLGLHLPRSAGLWLDLLVGNEIYAGHRFNCSGWGVRFFSQLKKQLYIFAIFRSSGAIFYDPSSPYGGDATECQLTLDYQPTNKFNSSLSACYADFFGDSSGEKVYDCLIVRSRNTFQINKYLFVRGIGEYNTYRRRLVVDFLTSFTYIPGTVVHLGYGAAFDRLRWGNPGYVNDPGFLQRKRGFFFKVSYLWRL